jgi:tetratricopeptide (TPR) repeat protein
LYKGFFEEATEHLLKAVDFCESIDLCIYHALDHNQLAEIYFDVGEYQKSKKHYSNAIRMLEHNKFSRSFINVNKMSLARAKVMNNEKDIDLKLLNGYLTENKLRANDGWMRRSMGEILMNLDKQRIPEAEDWIKSAIDVHKSSGMRWQLGRNYGLYAELFRRKGDQIKSKENLIKAIDILKECGADGWVEKYETELATLS